MVPGVARLPETACPIAVFSLVSLALAFSTLLSLISLTILRIMARRSIFALSIGVSFSVSTSSYFERIPISRSFSILASLFFLSALTLARYAWYSGVFCAAFIPPLKLGFNPAGPCGRIASSTSSLLSFDSRSCLRASRRDAAASEPLRRLRNFLISPLSAGM